MYCIKCGKRIPDGSSFCPSCGSAQKAKNSESDILQPQSKQVKNRGCGGCLGMIVVIIIAAAVIAAIGINAAPAETPIVNALEYANISTEELFQLMGQPDHSEDWNSTSPYGVAFAAKIYTYNTNNQTEEFIVVDDKVVRLTCYAGDNRFECSSDKQILRSFGITATSSAKKIADTGAAIRIQTPCDGVADFWVVDIENDKCSIVKITFNSSYF